MKGKHEYDRYLEMHKDDSEEGDNTRTWIERDGIINGKKLIVSSLANLSK